MARVKTKTIPFPVKGWNTRDPLEDMDPQYAVELVNVFPRARDGALRRGFAVHSTGMGSGAVPTLIEYAGETGTRQLIAAANGDPKCYSVGKREERERVAKSAR